MLADLERSAFPDDVQDERLRTIEAQHVQTLEGDRGAQREGETRQNVAKGAGLGDEASHRREHVNGIGLSHRLNGANRRKE